MTQLDLAELARRLRLRADDIKYALSRMDVNGAAILESCARMLCEYAAGLQGDHLPDDGKMDHPNCSVDPASCPENEGHGCCQANPEEPSITSLAERCGAFLAPSDGHYGNLQAGGVVFSPSEWQAFCAAVSEQLAVPVSATTQAPLDEIDAILFQCDRGNVSLPWLIAALRGIKERAASVPSTAAASPQGPTMLASGDPEGHQQAIADHEAEAASEKPVLAGLSDEQIATLKSRHGITSSGRGIREFTQVADFVRAILKLAQPEAPGQAEPRGQS